MFSQATLGSIRAICKRYPPLSVERELELFADAKAGSSQAVNLITLHHMRLVWGVACQARKYRVSVDEAFSEAYLGVVKAIPRFDPGAGVRFATYASRVAKRHVNEYVARANLAVYVPPGSFRTVLGNIHFLKEVINEDTGDVLDQERLNGLAQKLRISAEVTVQLFLTIRAGQRGAPSIELIGDVLNGGVIFGLSGLDEVGAGSQGADAILCSKEAAKRLHKAIANALEASSRSCPRRWCRWPLIGLP